MPRRVVKLDVSRPYHEYAGQDGAKRKASPTVDSLLKVRSRKAKAKASKRLTIRLKREM